jgi:hypothetical protein
MQRKKPKRRRAKEGRISLDGLLAAQKLVAETGSIESAKEALGVLEIIT